MHADRARPTTHGPTTREQQQIVRAAAVRLTPAERHAAERSVPLTYGRRHAPR